MRVVLAKKIGFCFGVRRAIEMAEAALKNKETVYSLGSIIHNKQVVNKLSEKGLRVIKDIGKVKKGVIVVSSHGISPEIASRIRKRGLRFIDTTCPFVRKAQRIGRSLSDAHYDVIIVGDSSHPEVKALVGFVSGNVFVVKDKNEAKRLNLRPNGRFSIISQTTQSVDNFLDVAKAILDKRPKELKVINTICKDVEARQEAARALTKVVDKMLVVGGKTSANTKRLYDVCRRISGKVYRIETDEDLDSAWFKTGRVVGITSGSSTPDWIVRRVVNKVKGS